MGEGGERKWLRHGGVAVALLAALALPSPAQTRVDLRSQSKSVDFSAAPTTKPSKTGTTLPAGCNVGETFLKTDAPVGQNLYVCTLANTWSVQGTPGASGNSDKVLSNDGTTAGWRAVAGDVSGRPDALTVAKIQGRAVSATAPAAGQLLIWNALAGLWEPANLAFGLMTGTVTDAQVGTGINANKIGSGAVNGTTFGYLANVTSDLQAQLNGKAAANQGVAGDLSGNLGATKVTALQNRNVAVTAPTNGQALIWNSGASQWEPQSPGAAIASVFGRTGSILAQSGDYTFGQIAGTVTDSQIGGGVNANKIGGGTVGNSAFGYLANATSDIQTQINGRAALAHSHNAGGDASGDIGSMTVTALRSRAVAATAPVNGQALIWNSAALQWQPQNQSGGVISTFGRSGTVAAQLGDYSFGQISGTVTDSQISTGINANKIGAGTVSNSAIGYLANATGDLQVQINGKSATTHSHLSGGDASGDVGSMTVTALRNRAVSTAAPSNGQSLTWNSTTMQWEPQNSAGAVLSVFGRTGAVGGQTGDYSFGQISGTVTDSQVSTGINATKIGGGTVINTVFGYLANITADVQNQFNGKAASAHSHTSAGDVTGDLSATTVGALRNRSVSAAAPANGQVLVWSSAAAQWQPQNQTGPVSSTFGRLGAVVAQAGDYTFGQISGTLTDAQLSAGISANKIGAGTVGNTALGYLSNVTSDIQAQLSGKASTSQAVGGDVGGTLGATKVTALQNRSVAATAPTNGQTLAWNAALLQWEPQSSSGSVASVFGRAGAVTPQTGDYTFAQISGSVTDSQVSTGINANKIGGGTVGNAALGYLSNVTSDIQAQLSGKASTSQAVGGDVSGNLGAVKVAALQNRNVAATAPTNGQTLTWNAGLLQWEPQSSTGGVSSVFGRTGSVTPQAGDYTFGQISGTVTDAQMGTGINANKIGGGTVSSSAFGYLANVSLDIQTQLNGKASITQSVAGDATGNLGAVTVTALQNRGVSATAPANGQTLVWNSAASQWQPQNATGGLSSAFGRTGAVTAQSGDYTFGQISGTVTDPQLATGLNAAKIGGGTVGNTAFGYLANVTADLQTQLNGKASTSLAVGADLSGPLSAPTVAALQNRSVANTAPANGQALIWNAGASQWQPQNVSAGPMGAYSSSFISQTAVTIAGSMHQQGTPNLLVGCYDNSTPAMEVRANTVSVHPATYDVTITFSVAQSGRCVVSAGGSGSGGSGGGGASMGSQLGDFNVTLTTPTLLTVGSNCSTATPCNVRWGSRVFTFTSSATVTLTAGSGTTYFYVDSTGALTAGHNLTLTCTAPCSAAAGVAGFPVNAIPLFTWTATSGTWDATGGLDRRAMLSAKNLNAGAGIITLDTSSSTTIGVDSAAVPTYLTASATLSFGAIANGACASDLTFPMPGAVVGNSVAPGLPGGLEAGLVANMRVSAANTMAVRLCNLSGGAVSPASATYTGTIVRSF